jgi:hypothetical protein
MEKRIIYIPSLNYECYFHGNSWRIIHDNKVINVYVDSFHASPFYIIFENIEIARKQLKLLTDEYKIRINDIFPIKLILKDIVEHQQGYWLDLCLDFIIKLDCLDQDIVKILVEGKDNKKGFSQALRHKIKRIILLYNDDNVNFFNF